MPRSLSISFTPSLLTGLVKDVLICLATLDIFSRADCYKCDFNIFICNRIALSYSIILYLNGGVGRTLGVKMLVEFLQE